MGTGEHLTSKANVIHFLRPFRPGGVVLCKSTELTTPATSDSRYVTCGKCLALLPPGDRAIRQDQVSRYGKA
jgi:hypothetical protein